MSDSDEDRTISYGTPLDPYEEDEVPSKRKFQPADQYAVDDHGRRRFHGAFTGGFSAGFGNTVGSQEGWTPAMFKSSRSEKAIVSNQRPEDFMDDEDRGDYGIAPRQIQTQSEFSGQRASKRAYHDGPIPGEPVLDQLLRVVHETAAVRMLKAMGWRPGQGAGDRLTREQKRKARDQQKVYGCYVPPEMRQQTQSDEESTDSEYDYDTLFAPDDYEPYILSRKNDRFGLGYQGLSRHSVLGNLVGEYGSDAASSKSHLVMKEKGKKVSIRGQAFGVGAFEADDEDIYAREDMSHYDFTLGGPAPQATKAKVKRDGRVLEGFLPASKPPPPLPSFPPPALPRDYVPAAAGTRRSRFEPVDAPQRDQGLGRHELTAEARGALLGEKPVPKIAEEPQHTTIEPNKPLPDDIIAKITGRNVAFVSKEDIPGKTVDFVAQGSSNTPDFISIKDSGKELKNVFKPFASNPLKQKRYENFLENRSSVLEKDGDMDKVTEWERERELLEFEQAAKLYRPLSGVMGDRFTHASQPDDALNPLTAVTKSSTNHGSATQEQIEAASKGVYGAGTRSKVEWRPEGVVCKRFNVPEPGVTRSEPKSKNDKQKVSYSIFSYLESSVHDKDSFAKEQSTFSGSKSLNRPLQTNIIQKEVITPEKPKIPENVDKDTNNSKTIVNDTNKTNIIEVNKPKITAESIQNDGRTKRMTVAELFLKESEKNKAKGEEVTETINSFDKMDLYKSIFLSDSEEEAFETSADTKNDKTTNVSTVNDFVDAPKNVLRNTSPPRGIFANIDFDEINSWKRTDDIPETSQKDTNNKEKSTENNIESMDTEIYGPKIPENLIKRLESSENNSNNNVHKDVIHEIDSSSSDSWVDANAVKSKKKKKKLKSKKDKFRHKKKKHKKKDR